MAYYFSKDDIFHRPQLPVDVFRVVHDEAMPDHRHEFSELVIVTRGEAVHIAEGRERLIMMGDIFTVHPPTSHGYQHVNRLELINILFVEDMLHLPRKYGEIDGSRGCVLFAEVDGESTDQDISETHFKISTDKLVTINEMVRELEEAIIHQGAGSTCIVASCFMKVVGTLLEWQAEKQDQIPRSDYQVARAFSYIADNYADRVALADLTNIAGMSESSLTRAFRKLSGLTPIEYVISYRIRQSCRLLQYTDKNVTEIAFECGFSDSNYFSRRFHDLVELTPLEYRRQSRKREPPFDSILPQPSESEIISSPEPT